MIDVSTKALHVMKSTCQRGVRSGDPAQGDSMPASEPVVTASLMLLSIATLAGANGAKQWFVLAAVGWIAVVVLFGPGSEAIRFALPSPIPLTQSREEIVPPELPGTLGDRASAAQRFELLSMALLTAAAVSRLWTKRPSPGDNAGTALAYPSVLKSNGGSLDRA